MTVENDLQEGLLTTGNFTLQASMPNGKTLTISSYIYSHNTKDEISKQLDLYHDVIDRQRTKAEIPELELKLEQRIRNLKQIKDHMGNMEARQLSGKRLSPAELKQLDDLVVNIKSLEADIDSGTKAIADAKAVVL